MKKRIAAVAMVGVMLVLCACNQDKQSQEQEVLSNEASIEFGKEEITTTLPINKADKYECVIEDTVLDSDRFTYVSSSDEQLNLIVMNNATEDGQEFMYETCSYDMLEGKWSEPEICKWSKALDEKGYGYCFQRDESGDWYCASMENPKEDYENRRYHFYQLCQDGTVNEIELPKEMCGDDEQIYTFYFVDKGKIYAMIKEKESSGTNVTKTCLFDVATGEYEITAMFPGVESSMVIGNEFYSVTNAEKCGFLIRGKNSSQPERTLYCAGNKPEGGWGRDGFTYPSVAKDEGDNVYILLNDGIYGAYCKEDALNPIVTGDMISMLELGSNPENEILPFVCDLFRGADMKKTDFYVLIAVPLEDKVHFKYRLAHIKSHEK